MESGLKTDIDRLAGLAAVGAEQAAAAFAQLVGETIRTQMPVVVNAGSAAPLRSETGEGADPASTGVFFEFEGCLDAIVGILFPGVASEALVRRVVGLESGELVPPVFESALMEVGNILASHVASAIADALGSRLLPSIPSLAMEGAEEALAAFIEASVGADAPRIESAFAASSGLLQGRLVLVPTRGGPSDAPLDPGATDPDDL
ncbi:MAG TPA: hypothetical protein ENI85_17050 [Deltaproteobacteria bacterium]|nr:hypothetical protein [Deltaproteobacteria bacterium]